MKERYSPKSVSHSRIVGFGQGVVIVYRLIIERTNPFVCQATDKDIELLKGLLQKRCNLGPGILGGKLQLIDFPPIIEPSSLDNKIFVTILGLDNKRPEISMAERQALRDIIIETLSDSIFPTADIDQT